MLTKPLVSIIIATTCEAKRSSMLHRAIASIVGQDGVDLEVIIVVNGGLCEEATLTSLAEYPRLRIIRLREGNVSAARYAGACASQAAFFGFLDDDDEFLPDGLQHRVALFSRHHDADVVVTNGHVHVGCDKPLVPAAVGETANQEPAQSLLRFNWFASPGSLFRAETIDKALFDIRYKYFEWTYLFFLLLLKKKKIVYDPALTYRKYEDHPMSVSKSVEYAMAYPEFLTVLLNMPLDHGTVRLLRKKYWSALNAVSRTEMAHGRMRQAWWAHLKCIAKGGWRYLPYTWHLLKPL